MRCERAGCLYEATHYYQRGNGRVFRICARCAERRSQTPFQTARIWLMEKGEEVEG